jgi:hypothetical protein
LLQTLARVFRESLPVYECAQLREKLAAHPPKE